MSTEVVLIGLLITGIVPALRFNVLALPRPALFVGTVFGIEMVGYLLLRYSGYFDWKTYDAALALVAIASTQILVPEAVEQLLGSNTITRDPSTGGCLRDVYSLPGGRGLAARADHRYRRRRACR
ncbi:hypothetical protein [Halorientalis pallida]|uniref:Uncharacterized protein n=1 Tax=Halorientalis pallida TaxID=2479928 RepID=A0A498KQ01_9EURY|nr:hypothetical protein [Halorientalis pallida]RXK46162.1 hypothetical protein EAF64_20540 [Halorientalis pallida]